MTTFITMSEKYDGVNATWDGSRFTSRDGNVFPAPPWFTKGLPPCQLTGELWAGRGQFEQAVGIVRSHAAGQRWQQVRFMVFDGPAGQSLGEHAEYVIQHPCQSEAGIDTFYHSVVDAGGEGLVLIDRQGNRHKRKPVSDDDAIVIEHLKGAGKNANRLGSLYVEDKSGKRFKIGVGIPDSVRDNPPAVGSVIKFTFQGRTARGIPRFASFIGCRAECSLVA
jgi:DNA ligase-1